MNARLKLFAGALCALAAVGCAWLWFAYMERAVVAVPQLSEAAIVNPMLAATRLLQQRGRQVEIVQTLDALPAGPLPGGIVLMADTNGVTTAAQAAALEAWVKRGNLLVTVPRLIRPGEAALAQPREEAAPAPKDEEEEEEDKDVAAAARAAAGVAPLDESDPIGAALGVRLTNGQAMTARCDTGAAALPAPTPKRPSWTRIACVTLPGTGARLELDTGRLLLAGVGDGPQPAWSDENGEAIQGYALGRGSVVMLARNYFNNYLLRHFDHGELLAALSAMHPAGKVYIVQRLGIAPWYLTLWRNFAPALLALALTLGAALWMALRRFGPRLPAPAPERRSLMEHIGASGAWMWQSAQGREQLLASVRARAMAVALRRVPALAGKPLATQIAQLAELTGIGAARLEEALDTRASGHPQEFTRQIGTLEELRKTYERH
jgi:hypothetical protein